MTIQEAIQSNCPARRSNRHQFYYFVERKIWRGSCLDKSLIMIGIDDAEEMPISRYDILATDWEIKP